MNIIWDFDGVIADTELIWVENRRLLLNKYNNLEWDLNTAYKHLGGMSDATKDLVLRELGIELKEGFWDEALEMDYQSVRRGEMLLTPNIKDVLEEYKGRQCVATGGIFSKTKKKVDVLGLSEYFNEDNLFCADMVRYGKPEPDVFLYAQESMGWDKKDCVIVEDSIAGMIAGKKAGILTVAFVGNTNVSSGEYLEAIKSLGIENVFYDMLELKKFLRSL